MKTIKRQIVHDAIIATTGAGAGTFYDCGEADFVAIMASCDSGATSCVWSMELKDTETAMTGSPFVDVDESYPPDPTAGLHTVLTARQQWRLFDVRGIDAFSIRLNTRTGADEVFSCLAKLLTARAA